MVFKLRLACRMLYGLNLDNDTMAEEFGPEPTKKKVQEVMCGEVYMLLQHFIVSVASHTLTSHPLRKFCSSSRKNDVKRIFNACEFNIVSCMLRLFRFVEAGAITACFLDE